MSGGVLVVVDRLGRPSRRFPLTHGLATIGRDPDNDIRIVLPEVVSHHATILIHDAQAVIRSTGGGVTLVNGRAVSVAPLSHGDEITVGGRALRWEYSRPRTAPPPTGPLVGPVAGGKRARGVRERRSTSDIGNPRERAVQLALEMAHRASMPGSAGGKQVAIVQPQRRDAADNTDKSPARASPLTTRRTNYSPSTSLETEDKSKRKSSSRASPKSYLHSTTKATLWIESRKTSPRRKAQPARARRSLPVKRSTPLRMTVLKRAQSAHKTRRVIKIEAPLEIDHTKQAAIVLMTGPALKSKLNVASQAANKNSPSYLVKKPSPVPKTPRGSGGRPSRGSKATGSAVRATPSSGTHFTQHSANRRSSKRYTSDRTVSILEISDSSQNSTGRVSGTSKKSSQKSPSLPSPKKSAMKDQSKKSLRKTESIKFDLSNLETQRDHENDVGMNSTRYESDESEEITLRYSESSAPSPSPRARRSIHARSERMLERAGAPLAPASPSRTWAATSPSARRSLRATALLQRVLDVPPVDRTRPDATANTIVSDRTRSDFNATLSPDRTRSRLSAYTIASDRSRSDFSATLTPDHTRTRASANTVASDLTRSDVSATIASDRVRSRLSANVDPDRTRSDLSATLASDRTRSRLSANADPDRTRSDVSINFDQDRRKSDASATTASDRSRSLSARDDPDRTRTFLSATAASERSRSRLSATVDPDRTRSDLSATLGSERARSRLSARTAAPDRTKSRVSANATLSSAFRTRTLTPRHNFESYSVVDLVSLDSDDATKSVYGSAGSADTSTFGTPAGSRKTRSTIEPVLLGSSTPYPGRPRATRSKSSSNTSQKDRGSVSSRRSKSLTTPENGQPVVVTRPPRASRSRSRIHDDLSALDLTEPDDSSPRTSKRTRTNVSEIVDTSNVDSADKTDVGMTTPENRYSPETEGTPVLSIRSLLDSSHGSFASTVKDRTNERETMSTGKARRSLRLSQEPFGSEDEGVITPTSAAKPSPESVKNKHSTAKKPQSKRSIIDDLNRSDIMKQLFDSPVKRKLTQSMSEFSRKRLFDEVEDTAQVKRPTRRTLATAESAPFCEIIPSKADEKSQKRQSTKNDLTDVRGVKAMFGKRQKDDLRRVTGVGKLFRKTSPKNDLTDVRGVRKMFQKKSPDNDLRNVSGMKRVLRASPKNDLTDVRGVREMFKETKKKNYQDVSGVEELFRSRDRSADAEELFDELVGRPPIKAVYSRTFTGRAPQRQKRRRRSLRVDLSVDLNNVEEWLQRELKRHLPSYEPSNRVTMELKKLATDTVAGASPVLVHRTRNSSMRSTSVIRGKSSPEKQVPAARSPARGARPAQRAVHSTPLKGRLQITMNASELGRVSPIAGPSRDNFTQIDPDVSISAQSEVEKPVETLSRSPHKRKSTEKFEKPQLSPENMPKRATRNKIVTESRISVANTRRRRSSVVVTKKAPVMSPKPDKATTSAQKQSPKTGTSRIRARAAKARVVVTKPSPKSKPRPATRTSKSSKTTPVKPAASKTTEKKPDSLKVSPKGKRKIRANASKSELQTKSRKAKVEELTPVDEPSPPKRTRRGNTVATSSTEESHGRKAQNQTGKQLETEEKKLNSRGIKAQNQTVAQSVIEEKRTVIRGRRAQNQTIPQPIIQVKETHERGRKAQTQTTIDSETEEKQPKNRARKAQNKTVPQAGIEEKKTNRRGNNVQTQPTIDSETEENPSNNRARKAQNKMVPQPVIEGKTNRRGRNAKTQMTIDSETEEKLPSNRGRKAQNKTIPQPVIEDKKTRNHGRKVQIHSTVDSVTEENLPNNRGRKAQNKTIPQPVIEDKKTNSRGRKAPVQASGNSQTPERLSSNRGRRAQIQVVSAPVSEEKGTNTRGKNARAQTSAQSGTDTQKTTTRGKKVQFDIIQWELSPRRGRKNKQETEPRLLQSEVKLRAARGRAANSDVSATERRGKRKATTEVDLSTVVPPKRGKTAEAPAKKVTGKQKEIASKNNKAENSTKENVSSSISTRQKSTKPVGTANSMTEEPVKLDTIRARRRQVAEPKEKVEPTRGKRKANVDPSPARGAKKPARATVISSPAPRARRAARGAPLLEAATKTVRGRRR